MDSGFAIHLMRELFWTGLIICLPVLLVTMGVGIVVSVIQVVTQIQEMTLTFVPKLIVAALTLVLCGSWMLKQITQYISKLWLSIPSLI